MPSSKGISEIPKVYKNKMKAVLFKKHGGAEVLEYRDVAIPKINEQ